MMRDIAEQGEAPAVDPVNDAIAILAATHDGNDLADADLRIVKRMVNASARPLPADANAAAADLKARVASGYCRAGVPA